jgi:predicted nucleic acid-binding protein
MQASSKSTTFVKRLTMKQRIYIDTSVVGGFYDVEFSEYTVPLFHQIRESELRIIYSEVTEKELINAPEKVKDLIRGLPNEVVDYVELTEEAVVLAQAYIAEKVVGKTSLDDCLHIALATIHKADYLVSWNFKHIVNVERIRGYNSVNIKLGYSTIDIRSPREFIKYED